MKVELKPGKYVVAVSGGVDSVVLLDLLKNIKGVEVIVSHFDHGIRSNSQLDRKLVQQLAVNYDLPFVYEEGKLGPKASEARARDARYEFLEKVRSANNAEAVVTAHHQDDVLETAILNMLRGTGRRGLTSLQNRKNLTRPLLKFNKAEIKHYALARKLKWREDNTNDNVAYLRNYIRHRILPHIPESKRKELMANLEKLKPVNQQIDKILTQQLAKQPSRTTLDRKWFIDLPNNAAIEVMAAWLRVNKLSADRKKLNMLSIAAKTFVPGKKADINKDYSLLVEKRTLKLV